MSGRRLTLAEGLEFARAAVEADENGQVLDALENFRVALVALESARDELPPEHMPALEQKIREYRHKVMALELVMGPLMESVVEDSAHAMGGGAVPAIPPPPGDLFGPGGGSYYDSYSSRQGRPGASAADTTRQWRRRAELPPAHEDPAQQHGAQRTGGGAVDALGPLRERMQQRDSAAADIDALWSSILRVPFIKQDLEERGRRGQ